MLQSMRTPHFVGCKPEDLISVDASVNEAIFSVPSDNCFVFPGFCDVHVHFREPGFSYKETISSGTAAAAAGGYTAVCTMPNLNPVPDCSAYLQQQKDIITKDASIRVYPYAAITVGQLGKQLVDFKALAPYVIAFSDDGRGVQDASMMLTAMKQAKEQGKMIVAHCEDNALLHGGYVHLGDYCRKNGHKGICSESEYRQVERDLELVAQTGCAYHVCHISSKESVELIRQAKKDGLNVTCETAPHYLVLDDSFLQEDGRFKMNPPIRSAADRQALIEGITDGTVDMIATDHAPHSAEEKSKGLKDSLFGVVGLETAFPVLYTCLVEKGIISLEHLIDLLAVNPRNRFGIAPGNDYTVWDLSASSTVEPDGFLSKGRATPFAGWQLKGICQMTVCDGKIVYRR